MSGFQRTMRRRLCFAELGRPRGLRFLELWRIYVGRAVARERRVSLADFFTGRMGNLWTK